MFGIMQELCKELNKNWKLQHDLHAVEKNFLNFEIVGGERTVLCYC